MNRPQLEHILRAAAAITGNDEFVIIGSQAILGQYADPPAELLVSLEADLFSLQSPTAADLIDGSIGEASPFHQEFGYYAHGVGPETAVLPEGWQGRLVPFQTEATGGATGLCLEAHDLAVSKLIAGRNKDREYIRVLLCQGFVDSATLHDRLRTAGLDPESESRCVDRLRMIEASVSRDLP